VRHRGTAEKLFRIIRIVKYLVSNFDEQGKCDDDEQIVKNANSSHDDIDDLECQVTDVAKILPQIFIFREVVPDISRQRGVLHRL